MNILLAEWKEFRCAMTTSLIEAPCHPGRLSIKTEGVFGFCSKTCWKGEHPDHIWSEFFALITHNKATFDSVG